MPNFRVTNIEWETDGAVIEGLPSAMDVEAEDEDDAVNRVSDEHGWLIANCRVEEI